jgi:sialate O-acetylesterase
MLRRFRAAGGRIKGILWYQGEADARNPSAAAVYGVRFRDWITAVRQDFGRPDLSVYFVQLGRMLDWAYYGSKGERPPEMLSRQWTGMREGQRALSLQLQNTGMATAIDLELADSIHLNTASLQRLGKRLARLALVDLYGVESWKKGPLLGPVRIDSDAGLIYVRYTEINGSLRAKGRVSGFSLHCPDGAEIAALYDAQIDPKRTDTVVLKYADKLPQGVRLAYGWGTNPYCNLVDDADMAAPCFGPLPIEISLDPK